MKMHSIAAIATLSALASASAAAQSAVTLYGVADVGVTYGRGSVASRLQMSQGNLAASRLGFRGTEDLGGGNSALFTLEAGINVDDGGGQATNPNNQPPSPASTGIAFNRLSYVGLAGPWGQVRLGRDWTPTFTQYLRYDVANGGGLGVSQSALNSIGAYGHPAGLRASNAIEYMSPSWGGLSAHLMYALGENASNAGAIKNDGKYAAVRLSYVGNGLDAGLAYATYNIAALGDIHETVAGATYGLPWVKLHAMYTKNTTGSANSMTGGLLGISKAFGATEIRASVSTASVKNAAGVPIGDARKLALMGIHNLSKRTSLYAVIAANRNSNGAASIPLNGVAVNGPNGSAEAVSIGVRHSF